ncbi:MAG: glutamine-hydrolyzing carbamoyl-phosphate synthase small subunit [Chloroflexi bacterium]|nr:glutamine-hydrolyzing carbamoyl-phosphate synthase small subunit [Chloroflexota bacterium]
MSKEANLILEDGSVYTGYSFGSDKTGYGEVVFNTSMTGYQEMLTDPSYAGQVLIQTYPLSGNYGINANDFQSKKIQVSGFVVVEDCHKPNHWQSKSTLHDFLEASEIPGICGVDTRSLTRHLRNTGVMMGIITTESPESGLKELKTKPRYTETDFVPWVSTKEIFQWRPDTSAQGYSVVVLDCGVKYNILRILASLGCLVTVVPATTPPDKILELVPDGIVISPGPGDPALTYLQDTVKALVTKKPVMGICLGHQLIARAFGNNTYKLKFGHRGANHPVKDISTGQVFITAQNHGYAVDGEGLKGGLEVSQFNLNDGTVEGLRHRDYPVFAIQYHSEASPGPHDTENLFTRFINIIRDCKA